jgi:O-antigen/teichoic acid export membrane protein
LAPHALPSLPFIIAGACLAVNIPLGIASNIWFGLQKGAVSGFWDFIQTLLMLGFLLLAAWAGAGIAAMVAAVYGAMLCGNAGSLMHLLWSQPKLRPRTAGVNVKILQQVLRNGLLLSAISIVISCGYVFDNVLTLDWLGPDAAARMTVAMRLCITALGLLTVATQALWPAFVEAVAVDDHLWVRRSFARGTGLVLALALGGSAVLLVYGAPVLRWWLHADLHLTPLLFWAMAAWIVVLTLPRVAGLLLNAVSMFWGQLAVQALAAAGALGVKFFLSQRLGVAGVLLATPAVWLVTVCPAYGWMAMRWIQRKHMF